MTLLTEIRKVAQIGIDGKLLPSQAPDFPVDSVNGLTGNVFLTVAEIMGAAPVNSPVFTGNPAAPTTVSSDNSSNIATTAFVKSQGYAPLNSPSFVGSPSAPTPVLTDNDTSIATTAFVKGQGYLSNNSLAAASAWISFNGITGSVLQSYGIASCTKNGTGIYTIVFSTAMANANYAVAGTTLTNGAYNGLGVDSDPSEGTPVLKTTTSVRLRTILGSDTLYDYGQVYAVFFG